MLEIAWITSDEDIANPASLSYSPGATPESSPESIEAGIAKMCPLKRVAVPEDIARVVAFLASKESEWINGKAPLGHPQEQD